MTKAEKIAKSLVYKDFDDVYYNPKLEIFSVFEGELNTEEVRNLCGWLEKMTEAQND